MTGAVTPLEILQRWEACGGHWRVLSRAEGRLIVALRTCMGDEEVDRLHTSDPDFIHYIGDRKHSTP